MPSRRKKAMSRPRGATTMAVAASLARYGYGGGGASLAAATTMPERRDDEDANGTPPTPTPATAAAIPKRLVTTFESDRSSSGVMFDAKAKSSPVIVRGVDVNTVRTVADGPTRIEIWTREGTFRGSESDSGAWTLWTNGTIVGNGTDEATSIDSGIFPPVTIAARERRAFYVSFPDGPYLRYSLMDGEEAREYYVSRDLVVYGRGCAKRRGFGGAPMSPRVFNGALRYEAIDLDNTEPSKEAPTTPGRIAAPSDAETRTISTSFDGSRIYAGSMFDVRARDEHIEITSLAFHTYKKNTAIPIRLYTKEGTHRGFDKDISRWTLIASVDVTGRGTGEPTYLPEGSFDPVLVRRGERRSFYVTSDGPYLRATETEKGASNQEEEDAVSTYDSDLIVYDGVGKRHPVEGGTFSPRTWNGVLQYHTVVIPTSAPTTSQPTRAPTPRPTRSPTPRPTPQPMSSPFRLRLYWERGYYWQESRKEMWYCMECRNNCRAGDSVYVDDCSSRSAQQRFVSVDDTIRPAGDPSLCLTVTGYSEKEPIRVYRCGGGRESRQRFEGMRAEGRFELRPRGETKQCVSQMHHPKRFERIYPEECRKTRDHDTTYWIKY